MKNVLCLVVAAAMAFAASGYAQEAAAEKAPAAGAAKTACLYTCEGCHAVATCAGKCAACDKELAAKHVLAVKDGAALCCACGADCKCTLKEGDATKCSCDKEVVKLDLKGKYVCTDAACKCNTVSDKEGKCSCGKDLVQVK
jgi:hypothetical protein